MYDPVTAGFLQEDTYTGDPEDPLSLNLYTYCANNPIIYWDPTGHRKVKDILGTEIIESLYNKISSKEKEKSSNAKGTGNVYVTKQNLIDLGWNTDKKYLNDGMVNELNSMSQVMKETDDWNKSGLGDGLIEIGNDKYIIGNYAYRTDIGNTGERDALAFRGAGYMHLTGRDNYKAFYSYMKSQGVDDSDIIGDEGYKTVANKYAWESAAWYWTKSPRKSDGANLNMTAQIEGTTITKKVYDNGNWVTVTGNSTVFEVTRLVNGGTNGIADRIKYYNLVKKTLNY